MDPRRVVLTFDDGPSIEQTPHLLDILAKHNVKAAFFVLGKRLLDRRAVQIATRAAQEGHALGNHSFSHPDVRTLNRSQIESELSRTHELISKCHYECKFFRPPFGWRTPEVSEVAAELGYQTIMWNVNTHDSKLRSGKLWVDHTIQKIRRYPESVVLLHDIHESTVTAVDNFIQKIKGIPESQFTSYW